MRRYSIPLLAAAALLALAAPGSALAWFGHHHHHAALFAKLSGTGTGFGGATASTSGTIVFGSPLASGTYGASFSTNWSAATTRKFDNGATLTCAPSNATLVLHDSASSANTATGSLSGKSCTFTKSDGTVVHGFFGRGTVTGTGSLAKLSGLPEKAFFLEHADGTVKGMVVVGAEHDND